MASVWESLRREAEAAGETKGCRCGKCKHWAMDPRRAETSPGDDPARLLQDLSFALGRRCDKVFEPFQVQPTGDLITQDKVDQAVILLQVFLEKNAVYRVPTNSKRDERLFKAKLKGLLELLQPPTSDDKLGEMWPELLGELKETSEDDELMSLVRHHDPGWQLVSLPSFRCFLELQLIQRHLTKKIRSHCQPFATHPGPRLSQPCAEALVFSSAFAYSCIVHHAQQCGLIAEKAAPNKPSLALCASLLMNGNFKVRLSPNSGTPELTVDGVKLATFPTASEAKAVADEANQLVLVRRSGRSAKEAGDEPKASAEGLSKAQLKRRAKKAARAPPLTPRAQGDSLSADTPEGDRPKTEDSHESSLDTSASQSEESEEETEGESEEETESESEESGPGQTPTPPCESPDAAVGDAGDGWGWVAVGKRGSALKDPDAPSAPSASPPAKTEAAEAGGQSGKKGEKGKAESWEEWRASWDAVAAAGPWVVPTSPYTALRHHLGRIAQQALDNPYPRPPA